MDEKEKFIRRFFAHSSRLLFVFLGALWIGVSASIPPINVARADTGPAPYAGFNFQYQIQPIPIIQGEILECFDLTCNKDQQLLQNKNLTRLICDADSCWLKPYDAKYSKLIITFADRSRESNVFTKIAYGAKYNVIVQKDSLLVRETYATDSLFNPWLVVSFIPALVLTIVSELVIAAFYFYFTKLKINLWIAIVIVANILSLPIVWFLFPLMPLDSVVVIALAETYAVLFEAVFLYFTGSHRGLSIRHAGILSLLMNAGSFLLGSIIFYILAF
jgi:hypothetical protein